MIRRSGWITPGAIFVWRRIACLASAWSTCASTQAAEKAIKALLIRRGIEFPYVHDLSVLLSIVAEAGEDVPESVRLSRRLTPYAAAARYPGITERVTEEDHAEAVRLAESVVDWAKGRL